MSIIRMDKKYLVAALSVIVIVPTSVYGLKSYVRSKVKNQLPNGMTAEIIDPGIKGVTLKNVLINKDWIHGKINEIWISRNKKEIKINGGELDIDLDKRKNDKGESEERSISLNNVNAHVKKEGIEAQLSGISWNKGVADFKTGEIEYHGLGVHVENGIYEDRTFRFEKLSTKIQDIPEIPNVKEINLSAKSVKVSKNPDLIIDVGEFSSELLQGNNAHLERKKDEITLVSKDLTVIHPWLDRDPSKFLNVKVYLDKDKVGYADVNEVRINFDLNTKKAYGDAKCQEWVNSLPDNLKDGPMKSMRYEGRLNFSINVKPKPKLSLNAQCKATCSDFPSLKKFTYMAYKPDGSPFERTTGTDTGEWTRLVEVGRMPMAVMNFEDMAFMYHKGYLSEAFQNSFIENVQKNKFLRGGSTITQQTAKNLWLNRDKTIGRKITELFLAQTLESCMSKEQIMELYLNIIEFGPNTYGVKNGSKFWFKKDPADLDEVEAFWLASILTNPKNTNGPTPDALKSIEKLMESFAKQGRTPGFVGSHEVVDSSGWEVNSP